MNKEDFLKRLKEDLYALTDEERLKGLKYYEEYFGFKESDLENEPESEADKAENNISESADILSDNKIEVRYKGWIYYNDAGGLYKERANGKGKTKLSDRIGHDIKTAGDWLYYICPNGLYRTRTDGTLTEPVIHKAENKNPEILQIVHAADKLIFYMSRADNDRQNNYLYRIKTDGKRNKYIENNINFITAANRYIIYGRNDGGLYKTSLKNGKKKTRLCDDRADNIYIKRGWIYYNNLSDGGKLYKMRMDGKRRQVTE